MTYTQRSALGSIIYKWQKWVTVNYTGSAVTKVLERYDWLPSAQGMVKVREITASSQFGVGTWKYVTRLQRHLEYCVVQYGCYADTYPWARFKIYGNGTYWYEGASS